MNFRVTFSDNTEEYYKENPKDTQVSMTVEALSFNSAQIVARAKMISLVFWPSLFEIVSINRIDEPIQEKEEITENDENNRYLNDYNNGCRCEDCLSEVFEMIEHVHDWKVFNGFYVCANKCGVRLPYDKFFDPTSDEPVKKAPDEPVKKAPEVWCLDTGIQILDPDGWDRKNPESWYTPITRPDFIKRAMMSTCYRWPSPLFDEDREG
jgi:hypothetical protein